MFSMLSLVMICKLLALKPESLWSYLKLKCLTCSALSQTSTMCTAWAKLQSEQLKIITTTGLKTSGHNKTQRKCIRKPKGHFRLLHEIFVTAGIIGTVQGLQFLWKTLQLAGSWKTNHYSSLKARRTFLHYVTGLGCKQESRRVKDTSPSTELLKETAYISPIIY